MDFNVIKQILVVVVIRPKILLDRGHVTKVTSRDSTFF